MYYVVDKSIIPHSLSLSLYLCLHHGRPLRPERPDGLEDVDHPLVLHPLQHEGERHEDARPAHPGAAVHRDGALLPELLLGLVHLADEVDEALPGLGHPLLGPVHELELADGPGLPVSRVRHLLGWGTVRVGWSAAIKESTKGSNLEWLKFNGTKFDPQI